MKYVSESYAKRIANIAIMRRVDAENWTHGQYLKPHILTKQYVDIDTFELNI